MCRIAGLITHSLSEVEQISSVKEMCTLLRHGGPDDEGLYFESESKVALGHRRLSIIDLSTAGHQPMFYAEKRYVITYNGELYNYLELREKLEKVGCFFATKTDTEVILAAYAEWGVKAFATFTGMFAFAIWDNFKKEIILVRDPVGIKPLYYAATNEGLAFASEVKAFSAVKYLVTKQQDWEVFFMAYGHLPEPVTTLKKVKPLEKGACLIYKVPTKRSQTIYYAANRFIEKFDSKEMSIELVKDTLELAVKRHLISDAPIGVFLSGGLDSSIIALLANKHQHSLHTNSIYFENDKYSEKKYQDLLQEKLSGTHHRHLVKEEEFHSKLPAIIEDMDLPCCDGINTWFISKYARESGLKAVLSGIGGDELYGGYPSFERANTAVALQSLPDLLLKSGEFSDFKQLRRLAFLSLKGPVGVYLFLRGQFTPVDIARYLDADEEEVWKILESSPQLPNIEYLKEKNQISWIEINMYMQNQLLRDADVMSMAHGLEIRVPFLDTEFVKMSLQIESAIKYAGKFRKQLLIDSFRDLLPEQIWNRPKMGFSFPFKEWFSSERYADVGSRFQIKDIHKKLRTDEMHWSQFFSLLLLENYPNA